MEGTRDDWLLLENVTSDVIPQEEADVKLRPFVSQSGQLVIVSRGAVQCELVASEIR